MKGPAMQITLTSEQQTWIEAEVAAGRFPSVEAAVRAAVDNLMPGDVADLDWVKPLLDEARAESGSVPFDDVRRRLAERVQMLDRG